MQYNKTHMTDKYGAVIEEDKSVDKREEVAKQLWDMLQESPYTYGELLECLGWEDWRLSRILAGDEEIEMYELTHIAGALGKDFKVTFDTL